VHRLIEARRLKFVLTGSSARTLRRRGVNLLAGRALTRFMHPLTAREIGDDFDLTRALSHGCLPFAYTEPEPKARAVFVYTGTRRLHEGGIEIVPAAEMIRTLPETLAG
jgi:predicted AAA+ superfamily ATPase